MRTIPTLIATIAATRFAKRRPLPLDGPTRPGQRGRALAVLDTPRQLYLPPEAARGDLPYSTGAYITRSCHRYADELYTLGGPTMHNLWQNALKRDHMSAYDLWMSEALYLLNQGLCPPDTPGPSGGFTPERAIEGTAHDPAPSTPAPYHQALVIQLHQQQPEPPTPFTRWLVTDYWADKPHEVQDQSELALYFGWQPALQTWAYHRSHDIGYQTHDILCDSSFLPYLLQTDYVWTNGRVRRYHLAATDKRAWSDQCAGQRPWPGKPGYPFPVPPNWL